MSGAGFMRAETIGMREGEEIALAPLKEFLRDKLDGAADGIALDQFPDGH